MPRSFEPERWPDRRSTCCKDSKKAAGMTGKNPSLRSKSFFFATSNLLRPAMAIDIYIYIIYIIYYISLPQLPLHWIWPLNWAWSQLDRFEVGGLLEQGANPAQKNSSGKTAQEVRKKQLIETKDAKTFWKGITCDWLKLEWKQILLPINLLLRF